MAANLLCPGTQMFELFGKTGIIVSTKTVKSQMSNKIFRSEGNYLVKIQAEKEILKTKHTLKNKIPQPFD